ncbi:MAG: hypothetical protein CMJ25_23675 [Phycisphaerae bacterium]|nr:hypothetical protein [Phycisphaerae bacterium]|tara:strand:+ start:554 stop:805 length:252 start_codon:yes stop_codon:yes gene_type:complete
MTKIIEAAEIAKEARKVAKLKAKKMFFVKFEMWRPDRLDNVSDFVIGFTMKEAHSRMARRSKSYGGDYKVTKITETNEYDLCN